MLDPINHYHAIRLGREYVGFVCVGADARVTDLPAAPGVDDIGVGLAPDRVGHGLSRWLLPAVIESLEGLGVLTGSTLRAVILAWNVRSLAAAQRAGFEITGEHVVGNRRFCVLLRPRPASWSDPPTAR
jgi:RimJ/RimL family protein N-acetyltransferase